MQSDKVSETIKENICLHVLSKSGNNIFDSGLLSAGGAPFTPNMWDKLYSVYIAIKIFTFCYVIFPQWLGLTTLKSLKFFVVSLSSGNQYLKN